MRQNFYSREELMAMPLGKLNRLVLGDGIQNQDEEALINEVMNAKRGFAPMQQRVTLRKDLDIQTQMQEKQWDAELARRAKEIRPMSDVRAMDKTVYLNETTPEPQPVVEQPPIEPQLVVKSKRAYHRKVKAQ